MLLGDFAYRQQAANVGTQVNVRAALAEHFGDGAAHH